jgi:hypothetical protein
MFLISRRHLLLCSMSAAVAAAADAADSDPCTRFTWDVSQELAVMKQTPKPVSGATKADVGVPMLQVGKLYRLRLAPQSTVSFAVTPEKPTLDDGAHAGLVRFHAARPGRYRVSITSGHWIDVVDGSSAISSRDFQGRRGCERPHKIVEYELSRGDMTVQLSGAAAREVLIAVTRVDAGDAP